MFNRTQNSNQVTLPDFITSAQVARLIGYYTPTNFLHNRERLEKEHLFPLPMPTTLRRSFRWRRDEVLAWVERNGTPRAGAGQPNVHLMRIARSA
jgi:predicted DNA-binding transcriptional regulator AlpA